MRVALYRSTRFNKVLLVTWTEDRKCDKLRQIYSRGTREGQVQLFLRDKEMTHFANWMTGYGKS